MMIAEVIPTAEQVSQHVQTLRTIHRTACDAIARGHLDMRIVTRRPLCPAGNTVYLCLHEGPRGHVISILNDETLDCPGKPWRIMANYQCEAVARYCAAKLGAIKQ